MYNGIGLATVRGSGTNGYVQKNQAHVSKARVAQLKSTDQGDFGGMKEPRAPNLEIIDHNRKREVELKVMRLRDTLEEQGVATSEVEEKASELRRSLLAKLPPLTPAEGSQSTRPGETHAAAATKQLENAALKQALGISSEYVGGSSFDQDLQARQRDERLAKRAQEEEEVAAMELILAQEKEREERKRRKETRKQEKEERKKRKKQTERTDD